MSTIVYDEVNDRVYFNDLDNKRGSIFALKLANDENHAVQTVVAKQNEDEFIRGIAFDPIDMYLYWADSQNKRIYKKSVSSESKPGEVLYQFEDESPQGLALDVCRRKLYWVTSSTNKSTIERGSLTGTKKEVLIKSKLYKPIAIVVDQFEDRLYWIDDLNGNPFSVESANLQGGDRKIIYEGMYDVPKSLAVTEDFILYTDSIHDSVFRVSKRNKVDSLVKQENVAIFKSPPRGLVIRSSLSANHGDHPICKDTVKIMQSTSTTEKTTWDTKAIFNNPLSQTTKVCLNGGILDTASETCHCRSGFSGHNCETNLCHNFCVHGECFMTSTAYPQCHCEIGFTGERCETNVCSGFCLNGGRCELEQSEPVCQCSESHIGRHCEFTRSAKDDLCKVYCASGAFFPDTSNCRWVFDLVSRGKTLLLIDFGFPFQL